MSAQLKKIPSNLWVVWVGSISFQETSYASKPQVVSRYILSNLWLQQNWTLLFWLVQIRTNRGQLWKGKQHKNSEEKNKLNGNIVKLFIVFKFEKHLITFRIRHPNPIYDRKNFVFELTNFVIWRRLLVTVAGVASNERRFTDAQIAQNQNLQKNFAF